MMHSRARFARSFAVKLAIASSALALASCAAGYELRVDTAPTTPSRLDSVSVVPETGGKAADAVMESLKRHHGIQEGDGWHLTATLAVRSVDIGTATDNLARDGEWLETPRIRGARRGEWLHVLSISAFKVDEAQPRVVIVSARADEEQTPDALLRMLADTGAKALVEGHIASSED